MFYVCNIFRHLKFCQKTKKNEQRNRHQSHKSTQRTVFFAQILVFFYFFDFPIILLNMGVRKFNSKYICIPSNILLHMGVYVQLLYVVFFYIYNKNNNNNKTHKKKVCTHTATAYAWWWWWVPHSFPIIAPTSK